MCSATNAFGLLNAPSGWWYANTRPSRRRRRSTTWFASPISTDTPLLRPSRLNAVSPSASPEGSSEEAVRGICAGGAISRRRRSRARDAAARHFPSASIGLEYTNVTCMPPAPRAARKCTASSPSASSPEASSATASRRRGIARLIDSSAIGNSAIAPVVVPSSRRWYESAGRCAPSSGAPRTASTAFSASTWNRHRERKCFGGEGKTSTRSSVVSSSVVSSSAGIRSRGANFARRASTFSASISSYFVTSTSSWYEGTGEGVAGASGAADIFAEGRAGGRVVRHRPNAGPPGSERAPRLRYPRDASPTADAAAGDTAARPRDWQDGLLFHFQELRKSATPLRARPGGVASSRGTPASAPPPPLRPAGGTADTWSRPA